MTVRSIFAVDESQVLPTLRPGERIDGAVSSPEWLAWLRSRPLYLQSTGHALPLWTYSGLRFRQRRPVTRRRHDGRLRPLRAMR